MSSGFRKQVYETQIAGLTERGRELRDRIRKLDAERQDIMTQLEKVEAGIKAAFDKKQKAGQ